MNFMKKLIFILILISPIYLFAQKEGPTAPSAPQNFIAEQRGEGIFTDWDAPESDGGSSIDTYIVNYQEVGGVLMSGQTTETEYLIENLNVGVEYRVFITAVNLIGESAPTENININLVELDTTAPTITSEIIVSEISNQGVTVSWTTDEPTTSAIYYDVHRLNQHGLYTAKVLVTEHEMGITELLPCTTYFFVVGGNDLMGNTYTSEVGQFNTSGCVGNVVLEDVGELVSPESINNFSFDNATIEIEAPAGSVSLDSIFQIKRLSTSSVDEEIGCPAGAKPVGENIYDIKLLENYNAVANISSPVSVTINYDEEDLGSVTEESLSLYHYTEGVGWVKLNSCSVDKNQKTLTCQIDTFSKFMIAGEEGCDKDLINSPKRFYSNALIKIENFLASLDAKIKQFFWSRVK